MPAEIKNVFVLLLENRSFDHMLGFSGITGTDAVTGQATEVGGPSNQDFNKHLGVAYPASSPFHEPIPVDPAHEFPDVLEQLCGTQVVYKGGTYPSIRNSGFVSNYARSHSKEEGDAPGNFGQIMDGFKAEQLPVLNALARAFAVCDGWHSSLPGPTFPNRLFAMAASSGGLDHSPTNTEMIAQETIDGFPLRHGSIFDAVGRSFPEDAWRIYSGGWFPLVAALKGISLSDVHSFTGFHGDVSGGSYPWRLTWIEPDYGDAVNGTFIGGNSQHPMDCVGRGEELIKKVYETIRNSSIWESSLLIVTWDEHGGFFDHVRPGKAVAPGDSQPNKGYNQYGFPFTQLGVRVPAVIVSPWIPAGTIDHRPYDHSSIPKTIENVFGLSPLTNRDGAANSVFPLLTLPNVRTDGPPELPEFVPPRHPPKEIIRPGGESVNRGTLPVFLHIAMRHEAALSHAEKKQAVFRRAQAVQTLGQARQYLDEINDRVTEDKARIKG
jgi:phospholipase C